MNWMRRWMIGRRGMDQLSWAILGLCLFLTLLNAITHWEVLVLLSFAALGWCYFRMFSRNLTRREQENRQFLQLWAPFGKQLRGFKTRMQEGKTHRFFHCPQCKQTLRVPKGKGRITITCPKCKHAFVKKT